MVDYTQYLKDAHVSFSGNDPRKLFGLIDIKLFKNKKFVIPVREVVVSVRRRWAVAVALNPANLSCASSI